MPTQLENQNPVLSIATNPDNSQFLRSLENNTELKNRSIELAAKTLTANEKNGRLNMFGESAINRLIGNKKNMAASLPSQENLPDQAGLVSFVRGGRAMSHISPDTWGLYDGLNYARAEAADPAKAAQRVKQEAEYGYSQILSFVRATQVKLGDNFGFGGEYKNIRNAGGTENQYNVARLKELTETDENLRVLLHLSKLMGTESRGELMESFKESPQGPNDYSTAKEVMTDNSLRRGSSQVAVLEGMVAAHLDGLLAEGKIDAKVREELAVESLVYLSNHFVEIFDYTAVRKNAASIIDPVRDRIVQSREKTFNGDSREVLEKLSA